MGIKKVGWIPSCSICPNDVGRNCVHGQLVGSSVGHFVGQLHYRIKGVLGTRPRSFWGSAI